MDGTYDDRMKQLQYLYYVHPVVCFVEFKKKQGCSDMTKRLLLDKQRRVQDGGPYYSD